MTIDLHVEDGTCWCDEMRLRETALDRLYPDRCLLAGDAGSPNAGWRTCVLPAGHPTPCVGGLDRPGGPCHFCGRVRGGDQCSVCWTSLEGMPLADIKALFAEGAPDLSIDPVVQR